MIDWATSGDIFAISCNASPYTCPIIFPFTNWEAQTTTPVGPRTHKALLTTVAAVGLTKLNPVIPIVENISALTLLIKRIDTIIVVIILLFIFQTYCKYKIIWIPI